MSKAKEVTNLIEGSTNNYRILVKNSKGKFAPIEGIADGKPQFVINVMYGLVLWDLDPETAKDRFDAIKFKYPDLEFKFIKA